MWPKIMCKAGILKSFINNLKAKKAMEHPKYEVKRFNGKYVIQNDHYLNSSPLLREIADTMVYLQEEVKAEFLIHLGHQENIMLAEFMVDTRAKKKATLEQRITA